MSYKCLSADFETVTKRINHITKKLDKNNIHWTFNKISEHQEKIPVYDNSFGVHSKVSEVVEDVTEYNFTMDQLKIGKYQVLAVIEHSEDTAKAKNIIYNFIEGYAIPDHYRTCEAHCDHCNINRYRTKTALLLDSNNNIKQVGMSCIKEYTGIDASDIIGIYADISEITLEEPHYNYGDSYPQNYKNTLDFLISDLQEIELNGYEKNHVTACKAWNNIQELTDTAKAKYKDQAQKIIDYFKTNTFDNDFMMNIQSMLSSEYINSKHIGIAAYAPIAYKKEIELQLKKQLEDEKKKAISDSSNYYGNVGDKINLTLKYLNTYSYDTQYGYYSTVNYIHLFQDENGNQFKWSSSKALGKDIPDENGNIGFEWYKQGDTITLKGTIKEHSEYDGIKQTVLTRCKF